EASPEILGLMDLAPPVSGARPDILRDGARRVESGLEAGLAIGFGGVGFGGVGGGRARRPGAGLLAESVRPALPRGGRGSNGGLGGGRRRLRRRRDQQGGSEASPEILGLMDLAPPVSGARPDILRGDAPPPATAASAAEAPAAEAPAFETATSGAPTAGGPASADPAAPRAEPPEPSPPEPSPPPWRRYAAPAPEIGGRAMLAIVIDDVGPDRAAAERVLALAAPISVALMPDAPGADALVEHLRGLGREALLHVPMRPKGPQDPGPDAIAPNAPPEENLRRLRRHLARFEGYFAVNNHMGSAATASPAAMAPVMAELRARGLAFLDSRTAVDSVAAEEADRAGVPHEENDIFLDAVIDRAEIARRLRQAERIAVRRGHAIAIGHPHAATLDVLERWLEERSDREIALVPLSSVIARTDPAAAAR
ncbi:MAG: divergent polysaccharide deacetylase family protein, partial [Pseudomonadota bacterium]